MNLPFTSVVLVGVNLHSCMHVLSNLMLLRCCCWSYCVYCVLQFLSVARPGWSGRRESKVSVIRGVGLACIYVMLATRISYIIHIV